MGTVRTVLTAAVVPAALLAFLSAPSAVGQEPGRPVYLAEGGFDVVKYTSVPYRELPDGATLSRLSVVDLFHGDIVGDGWAEADLFTRADGSSRDVGMIHIVGSLGGRDGQFVIETAGSFDGQHVSSTWRIVPGSGSGELTGLRGKGTETAELIDGEFVPVYELTYYFE